MLRDRKQGHCVALYCGTEQDGLRGCKCGHYGWYETWNRPDDIRNSPIDHRDRVGCVDAGALVSSVSLFSSTAIAVDDSGAEASATSSFARPNVDFTASRIVSRSSFARRRMTGGVGWNTDNNAAISTGVRSASEKR